MAISSMVPDENENEIEKCVLFLQNDEREVTLKLTLPVNIKR